MNIAPATWSLIFLLSALSAHLKISADTYDPSASVFLFQKQMAKRGNAESQYKLGLMYETGSGANNSIALATSWYKKAARQNYKPASNRLTYLEIKKNGFAGYHKEWLKKLKAEARFNDGEALFLLGQMYAEGTGVNKSLTRSLKYLHKAAGGNIPGSEAEINRVEAELALLQKQYITEEEKNKVAPLLVPPTSKTVKTKPKSAHLTTTAKTKTTIKKVKSKTAKKKTRAKKTTNKKLTTRSAAVKPQETTKRLRALKTSPKKSAVIQTAPTKPLPEVEPHPMDSICGGRNRFSRGCR